MEVLSLYFRPSAISVGISVEIQSRGYEACFQSWLSDMVPNPTSHSISNLLHVCAPLVGTQRRRGVPFPLLCISLHSACSSKASSNLALWSPHSERKLHYLQTAVKLIYLYSSWGFCIISYFLCVYIKLPLSVYSVFILLFCLSPSRLTWCLAQVDVQKAFTLYINDLFLCIHAFCPIPKQAMLTNLCDTWLWGFYTLTNNIGLLF